MNAGFKQKTLNFTKGSAITKHRKRGLLDEYAFEPIVMTPALAFPFPSILQIFIIIYYTPTIFF